MKKLVQKALTFWTIHISVKKTLDGLKTTLAISIKFSLQIFIQKLWCQFSSFLFSYTHVKMK